MTDKTQTMTAAEYRNLKGLPPVTKPDQPKPRKTKNKYNNVVTVEDGMKFDSKLEARVYKALCAKFGTDHVLRQVSIPIGEPRVRLDFMILMFKGLSLQGDVPFTPCVFAHAKARMTPTARAKYNHLRDKHGIKVWIIESEKDV